MTASELLLIFTASLMGSVHCAAMCGGFTLSLARPGQAGSSLARMTVYHAGKLFTYVFIGLAAGLAGAAMLDNPAIRVAQIAFSALGLRQEGSSFAYEKFFLAPGAHTVRLSADDSGGDLQTVIERSIHFEPGQIHALTFDRVTNTFDSK